MSPNHTPKIALGANRLKKISLSPETLYYWSAHVFILMILFRVLVPLPQQRVFYIFFSLLSFGNCLFSLLFFSFMDSMPYFSGSEWSWPSLPSSESSSLFTHVPQSQLHIVTFLFILQLLSTFYLHHHLPFLCSLHHSTFYRSRFWYWRVPLLFLPYLYICSPSLLESV